MVTSCADTATTADPPSGSASTTIKSTQAIARVGHAVRPHSTTPTPSPGGNPFPAQPPRPATTSHSPSKSESVSESNALAILTAIAVKGRAPMTGYDRDLFGSAWTDDNGNAFGHNGCDTRNDILRRDLQDPVIEAGTFECVVLRGSLADPYTGRDIAFLRGEETSAEVQIDHVVPLGDAWQTGAQQWSSEKRQDFANDPLNLIAVDGPTNESKGDGDAATWLPPNRGFWCRYVLRQATVKAKYGLWMTAPELDATRRILNDCGHLAVPREPGRLHPPSHANVQQVRPIFTPPTKRHHAPARSGAACEPGYSPCLRITSDLDCGEIADSLKPIHVTGSDPYRLDADGDGLGCE